MMQSPTKTARARQNGSVKFKSRSLPVHQSSLPVHQSPSSSSKLPPPGPSSLKSSKNNSKKLQVLRKQTQLSPTNEGTSTKTSSSSSSSSPRKTIKKSSPKPIKSSSLPATNSASFSPYGSKPPRSPIGMNGSSSMRRSRSKSPIRTSAARKVPSSVPPLPTSLPLTNSTADKGGGRDETLTSQTSEGSIQIIIEEKKQDDDDDDEDVGQGSKFHDAMEGRDWHKLESLLKKFDFKYWRNIRHKIEAADALEASQKSLEDGGSQRSKLEDGSMGEHSPNDSVENSPSSVATGDDNINSPPHSGKFGKGKFSLVTNYFQDRSAKRLEKERTLVSPLLTKDSEGNTPLHLAFQYRCPERHVVTLIQYERTAASVPNKLGFLPLHIAIDKHAYDPMLDKIIKAYPNALKTKDRQGRTPIGLAAEIALTKEEDYQERKAKEAAEEEAEKAAAKKAKDGEQQQQQKENTNNKDNNNSNQKQQQQPQRYYWGTPTSEPEEDWQFRQAKYWSKVDYLLKDLMKRKKHIIPSEHGLLLEGLEGGAPPRTINRLISTCDKYLMGDDDLAGSALTTCVKRRYCLDTLEYLLENCRERTTMIVDYTNKALVTHYRFGCQPMKDGEKPYGKELIDWAKARPAIIQQQEEEKRKQEEEEAAKKAKIMTVEDLGEEKEDEDKREQDDNNNNKKDGNKKDDKKKKKEEEDEMAGVSVAGKEWWDSMKHIIFYIAYGKNFKENKSIDPKRHLLHAALSIPATPPSLIQLILLLHPETRSELCPVFQALPVHIMCTRWKHDLFNNEKDKTMERVIKSFLKPERELLARRHRGRLPIHLALEVGQGWAFLKPLVSLDKKAVGMRDPFTKLFPFQMAAMKFSSKNIAMVLRQLYTPGEWRIVSTHEKREEYAVVENRMEVRQVGTIYELLRRYPNAIAGKVVSRDHVRFSQDLDDAGFVSIHYLSWVYGRGSRGWKLRPANVKVLRDSILNANIARPLRPWFDRLKLCIWETSKNDALPQTDDYLLHAALYNPDTPPLIIELLLELYPMSAAKPVPGTDIYPLHIAAGTSAYHPQPFEIPNRMDSLRLTLAAYKPAVKLTLHGRLPLHICISRGKTWQEMKPLVQSYRQSLMILDPQTGLAPFQLMSIFNIMSKEHVMRFSNMATRQARAEDMDSMTVQERARFFRNMKKKQDLNALTSIYELLRHGPNAVYALSEDYDSLEEDVEQEEEEEEITLADSDQAKILGVAATLDRFLQDLEHSPTKQKLKDYTLTPQREQRSLGTYLRQQANSNARHLITPNPGGRPTLSAFLGDGNGMRTSTRSLISKDSSAFHNDYVKPSYDDDLGSFMSPSIDGSTKKWQPNSAGSLNNSAGLDSSLRTPDSSFRSGGKIRRGRRPKSPKRLPIKLPDLDSPS